MLFYLNESGPQCQVFKDTELTKALNAAQELRASGNKHVSISSEPGDLVGGFGVDSVENGVLPDGHRYEWSKAHRAGTKAVKT